MTTSVDTSYGSWPATTPPFITKYGVVTNPSTSFSTGVIPDPYGAPFSLFTNNEQGVWYDPSDFSTMFQDSAGTTPVTAVEQPVGLILDKSKGLVLGANIVQNGEFLTNLDNWNNGQQMPAAGSAVWNAGRLRLTRNTATVSYRQALTTTVGKWYVVTGIATFVSGTGNAALYASNTSTALSPELAAQGSAAGASGTFSLVFLATATTTYIHCVVGTANDTTYDFDNISVRELPGNAGKQATATARPVLRATPTRIDYDAVDDTLVATFASSLGTDCTVCRAVPSVGASILTAQTIGTTYTGNTDHCGLIIVNRSLTAAETASVTAYLNAKAGV